MGKIIMISSEGTIYPIKEALIKMMADNKMDKLSSWWYDLDTSVDVRNADEWQKDKEVL